MKRASALSIALAGAILCASAAFIFAYADTSDSTLDSSLCNQLFGLPVGTIATPASLQYLNPTTCAAYQDLITRYNPGSYSKIGLSNAKVQGITSLNPTFAVNLDNMLKAADAAGYHVTINSAYRTVAAEAALNPSGFSGNASASMHTKGLAADLQYPNDGNVTGECDGASTNKSAAYTWVYNNDSTYHLGQYDQLHAHLNGECNHVEAVSGSTGGGLGPGGGTVPPANPLQAIGQALGLSTPQQSPNGTPVPGQILAQDSTCLISNNPILWVTVPAGTPYPSNCLSGSQAYSSCPVQSYCSGNTLMYQSSSCTATPGQTCPYGCSNGACVQAPQQQAAPAAAPSAAPASSSGTSGTSVSTPASTAAVTTLTPPTLLPSSPNLLNTLGNPSGPSTVPATTTPIALNAGDQDIAQLQAEAPPGVTYASPASTFFPGSGEPGNGQSGQTSGGSTNTNENGNSITTTAGSGYELSGGTNTGPAPESGGSIASTQAPSGADTFDAGGFGNAAAPNFQSPSTFNNGALSLLGTLRAEVVDAINFLTLYTRPFGGAVPSQQIGE